MTLKAHTTRWLITLFLAVPAAGDRTMAQPVDQRRGPLPPGSTIEARDGDTVLIDDDARVRVIRRRHARVRAVYDPTQRWLILLAGTSSRNGITTDSIDAFIFHDVEGDWTLETRWEGDSTLDVYALAGQAGYAGVGFQTPSGRCSCSRASDSRCSKSRRRHRPRLPGVEQPDGARIARRGRASDGRRSIWQAHATGDRRCHGRRCRRPGSTSLSELFNCCTAKDL
jgi:hypothetical protein